MSVRIINQNAPDGAGEISALLASLRGNIVADGAKTSVPDAVADIIRQIAAEGDDALIRFTSRFDDVELAPTMLRVSPQTIADARDKAEPEFLALIQKVAENIRQYQESIKIQPPAPLIRGGRKLSVRYTPLRRVGVYVPGGRAFYPSTVLMTVIPAMVAGVDEIVMVSPPTTDGDVNPMVLALAGELGIKEVYRIGGAQAIAAMALGTKSISAVDKIVGPGNAFVAEAKRQLFGRVGIDSIAGPSEVLIVADKSAPPGWIAADMLAQAEHNPGSAVLVTTCQQLAQTVQLSIDAQVKTLERSAAIVSALEKYCAIIVVPGLAAACELANEFATEHLQIMTADSSAAVKMIRNAGAIFVGPHTPVPLGDYYAGPSHVLPTGSTAKFFSPLSVNDFIKSSSLIEYDEQSLASDAADVIDFATREGLTAHANAVRIRTV